MFASGLMLVLVLMFTLVLMLLLTSVLMFVLALMLTSAFAFMFVSVVAQEIGPVRNNLSTMTPVVASDLLVTTGEYSYACKTAIVIC